jgi:hypothetical protein
MQFAKEMCFFAFPAQFLRCCVTRWHLLVCIHYAWVKRMVCGGMVGTYGFHLKMLGSDAVNS